MSDELGTEEDMSTGGPGDSGDIDALWGVPAAPSRRTSRSLEHEVFTELARGRHNGLEGLLRRHTPAAWYLAAVITLDVAVASNVVVDSWDQILGNPKAMLSIHGPFRRELLRDIQRNAFAVANPDGDVDIRGDAGQLPFVDDHDPSLITAGFTLVDASSRAALWLTDIERIPAREVATMLGLGPVISTAHMVDASLELMARTIQSQRRSAQGRCAKTVERFADYLDGGLRASDMEVMHRHLEQCADCSARLDALEDPMQILASRMLPAPAEIFERVVNLEQKAAWDASFQ